MDGGVGGCWMDALTDRVDAGHGEPSGTFGRFPVGQVHFQMYFGPLGCEKKSREVEIRRDKCR